MKKLIRKTYDYFKNQAQKPYALWVLAFISFFGSIASPIPSEALLLPICISDPKKAWRAAWMASFWSVLGGIAAYAIGYWFFDSLGTYVIHAIGAEDIFSGFASLYDEWGALIVFGSGFTPFPFKVITLASGFVKMNPMVFVLASVVSRFARFYLIAYLLNRHGEKAQKFIEEKLEYLSIIAFLLILGVVLLLRG